MKSGKETGYGEDDDERGQTTAADDEDSFRYGSGTNDETASGEDGDEDEVDGEGIRFRRGGWRGRRRGGEEGGF